MLSTFGRVLRWLEQKTERLAKSAASLSGWLYLFTALLITSDVITRKFFGFSSRATDEFSSYALAAASALSMAYALKMRSHVRVEVLLVKFPKTLQGYLNLLSLIGLAVLLALLVYHMGVLTWDSIKFSTRSSTVYRTPLAWPQSVWIFGYALFLLLAVVLILDGLREAAKGKVSDLAKKLGPLSMQEQVSEAVQGADVQVTRDESG